MRLPGRSFWIAQVAGWSGYALLMGLSSLPTAGEGLGTLVRIKLSMLVAGLLTSTVLGVVFENLLPKKPGVAALGAAAAGGSIALAPVFAVLVRLFLGTIPLFSRDLFRGASNYAVTLLAWSALYLTVSYRRQLEAESERALRATALASEAQLQMLRYQVNPHFLFNALNSIRALIDEDPARARAMVTELAEFFRYSVLTGRTDDAPLSAELEALENYLAIQKIRFEEKLDVSFDVSPEAGATRLPGFLVHPLVENAVKYGMETSPPPLRVAIAASRVGGTLRVAVKNSGRWRADGDASGNGTGTGLANVRERLRQLYPGRHRLEVEETPGWVCVSLEIDTPAAGGAA